MSENICKDSEDALNYWLKEAKGNADAQSAWAISLDAERRFIGCDSIAWRFYTQSILLADEALCAAKKRGAEEFIFLHNRPGIAPGSILTDSKSRARAMILAARSAQCSLLDYLLRGETNEKYRLGIFSLCHFRSFSADDPFPPRVSKNGKAKAA